MSPFVKKGVQGYDMLIMSSPQVSKRLLVWVSVGAAFGTLLGQGRLAELAHTCSASADKGSQSSSQKALQVLQMTPFG